MSNLSKLLKVYLDHAKSIGLSETDVNNAREFLEAEEFGLCFDTVVTQLYEYEIRITRTFFLETERIANEMGLDRSEFVFLEALI